MNLMTIGEFAARTRLSPKALRLYDRLGLLAPALTDPATGYRRYRADQVGPARLIALLRRIDMPLPVIAGLVTRPPAEAAEAVGAYWAQAESVTAQRRALVFYIQATLRGEAMNSYDIQTRAIPARTLVSVTRHLHLDETDAFFGQAFARLRSAGPGIGGIAGAPFVVYYGEVSDDSDGPLELCRPVADGAAAEGSVAGTAAGGAAAGGTAAGGAAAGATGPSGAPAFGDLASRTEAAHDEVFIRMPAKDMNWPGIAPALDALEAWLRDNGRQPAAPMRQVLIADLRTAAPETPAFDLSVPLR
jgi:DNA-binding transcriptional MerR regulator